MVFASIATRFKFRTDAIARALRLGERDRLRDSFVIPIEIERPLIQRARRQRRVSHVSVRARRMTWLCVRVLSSSAFDVGPALRVVVVVVTLWRQHLRH